MLAKHTYAVVRYPIILSFCLQNIMYSVLIWDFYKLEKFPFYPITLLWTWIETFSHFRLVWRTLWPRNFKQSFLKERIIVLILPKNTPFIPCWLNLENNMIMQYCMNGYITHPCWLKKKIYNDLRVCLYGFSLQNYTQ